MKARSYSISEVFENTLLNLTYEFYSSKHTQIMVEQLSDILGKNVVLTGDKFYLPSPLNAILLKEYNGDRPRYQLKIGQTPYMDINPRMGFTLMWINENAVLDYSTILKTSMTFNHHNLQTLRTISNMDTGKMILRINESYFHNRFPESQNSPFSMSIKRIVPLGNFINASEIIHNMKSVFQLPVNEYYGIDFSEQHHGNLNLNYICGEYSSKPDQIKEAYDYFILNTYQILNETEYTVDEINELQNLTSDYLKLKNLYYNYDKFLEAYPDIKVMADLDSSRQVIKSKWAMIRNPLFHVMFESGFKKGKFNWDSENGTFQLKNAELSGTKISGFDLVKCKISGCILENVHTWGTEINNSRVKVATLVSDNKIKESFLQNIRADRKNSIDDSIIRNNGEILNCDINKTLIFQAGIGKSAKLDEGCTLIEISDFRNPIRPSIAPTEIRDYRWIKSLGGKKEDKGFENEYKTDY